MESSQCPTVPYSLSDIQLPESPGAHRSKSSKPVKNEDNINKTDSVSSDTEQPEHADNQVQSNGMSVPDNVNSSQDVSEPETRENSKTGDSPKRQVVKKECNSVNKGESRDSRSESSDRESDTNEGHSNKRKFKYAGRSLDLVSDSKEQSKDNLNKERQPIKSHQETEESDNEKSSDSEKYKHRHSSSKRKSHDKPRKRSRRSRSRSSSSSSSGSSPKRRHSKKSITKNKSFVENIKNTQMSDKNADEKSSRRDSSKKATDLVSVPNVSPKKRLKIKRDNVAVDISSHSVESSTENSVPRKSVEKDVSHSSSSASSKPSNQDSTAPKEKEVSYVPRKVSLSNRKLNRKSSEDKSNETKSKKSKWGSFAAAQKTSQTISISTDSLKNWFPDFKLISEPAPAMDLEHDETSLSAAEDKNTNVVRADAANENDSDMKHDSTSQMAVEDPESQEPDFEEASEQGPVSKSIFIQNLVRPFTLNQLKDLLKQYGKVVEEYFWIDKIKSKCFVMYETEKEALKARNALNNTRWPSSNPKILTVEFSSEEELQHHKTNNGMPPKPLIEQPVVEPQEASETRPNRPVEEHKRKERERRKDRERSKPQPPVREWDKDKIVQDSPEREHVPKEEKSRSSEKKEKKESKKRANEDTPAKLLDDLFQKTKSAPCIYWLPLTEEQAKQREEERRMRKLEREKRYQQSKEQEEAEHRNRAARSSRRSREKVALTLQMLERYQSKSKITKIPDTVLCFSKDHESLKENRKSSTRSRSPAARRR